MRIGLVSILLAASLCTFLPPWRTTAQSANHPTNDNLSKTTPSFAEKYWLAGRYDGNRVIIYFDATKFGAPIPTDLARAITVPVAPGFFAPVELPASYIAHFENAPGAEHFALGDEYDLLLPQGMTATVRLTTLVGFENDEEVGNDSYIGALGTIKGDSYILSSPDCYAVRRHQQAPPLPPQAKIAQYRAAAQLVDDPVSFETETQIANLVTKEMKSQATSEEQSAAAAGKLYLKIQTFHTAGGAVHYYANASWKTGKEDFFHPPYALGVWIVADPSVRVVGVEHRTTGYGDFGLPNLINIVDLGGGKTGAIISVEGDDGNETDLVEYRDGASLKQMHRYQSIGVGE